MHHIAQCTLHTAHLPLQELAEQGRRAEGTCSVAKRQENRRLNRYRDVNPFDESRVKLQGVDNDYINASLVPVPEAGRRYILTQGPLVSTCGHLWQMIWQQRSAAIVMLCCLLKSHKVKCNRYWPREPDKKKLFREQGLQVSLVKEERQAAYTVRTLQLMHIQSQQSRSITQFHCTRWPDFGVPESPDLFLDFLFRVRSSELLGPEHGPAVVHCSAGIGRSGTFCLVDSCLVMLSKRGGDGRVNVRDVLLRMRRFRMGLIQTPGQLRFSYLAILRGLAISSSLPLVLPSGTNRSQEEMRVENILNNFSAVAAVSNGDHRQPQIHEDHVSELDADCQGERDHKKEDSWQRDRHSSKQEHGFPPLKRTKR
uniref:Tyrosine-protein phosphatase non-receptor type n=1 Tax=Eptatretus burgeri TaxID=7764 RepID=A0A8C4R3C2_EPTBU